MTREVSITGRHGDTLQATRMSDGVLVLEHTPGDNAIELDAEGAQKLLAFLLKYVV